MAELLRVPEVAADTTEVVLSTWLLAEGAAFAAGDPLVSIETDKAEVEVSADAAGVLLKTLYEPGVEVSVGAPVAVLGADGEGTGDIDALLDGLGVAVAQPGEAKPAVRREVPEPAAPAPVEDRSGRIFASPLARRQAKDAGLDLAELTGTGPGGRIVRRDIEAAIAARRREPAAAPQDPQPTAAAGAYEDIPHSRMRKVIATRLTESKQTTPHFYLRARLQVEALLALREQVNSTGPVRVSVNDLLIKAVAKAHAAVPEMNAVWLPEAVRRFHHVDISVAVATDNGLVTPVLRGVEDMSVSAISGRMRECADKARNGGLRPEDLQGGSITISNLGMFGVAEFDAIINPPQAAILAIGAIREEPVVRDGSVVPAKVIDVVLSVDHRPADGALAAKWLNVFTATVENPLQILI
ncbi:pyruvate dehydrogenase E2 component (dihydrolipoamide acetyltransferase) [Saccharopolyspora antimicrobica]|uniref:Dihydrolipoamide acetyltransferase component of pyruvate dehydrogenase complex n=1 Tax=Saccharopolyspora antimicrobica TaxID=455193 RepID=A0A1I4W6Z8_9PSEU|nr:dihydrolipoamide acetyltransferase family protein [Saccharopolyspora antimicrobica]RKT87029.1 pyruvate dehydrogenase E2 component (dihydrolipoamide acetyltransferase) [Saccharopolyspora antimicrobica]SFN09381.1 pyruvate dehydrogenase E2 component (dihydrolipoamide acetyltransferase) [Saccharopolyspora antimicrobica]